MGVFKNIKITGEMWVALRPLVQASNEEEFRSHLGKAEEIGNQLWGGGNLAEIGREPTRKSSSTPPVRPLEPGFV